MASARHIIEAVEEASSLGQLIYVERIEDRWRWSLAHPGGPYPLLRIAAEFLIVDYHRLMVGTRAIAKGISVLGNPDETPPGAWDVLELPRGVVVCA